MKVLEGKVAVVTGANAGIGLAIARAYRAEGARVFVAGRRQAQLDEVEAELGPEVTGIRCDVGRLEDLDGLYATVAEQAGRIDVLVANAGIGIAAPLGEITEEQFDAMFTTNVKGSLFTVQKALPLLSPGASIILTGSTAVSRPQSYLPVYGATKAAIRNLVRGFAHDAGKRQYRINVLSPGGTRTQVCESCSHPTSSPPPRGRFRSAAWPNQRKSPRQPSSSPPTLPATSTAPNSPLTAATPRSEASKHTTPHQPRTNHPSPASAWVHDDGSITATGDPAPAIAATASATTFPAT